MEGKVAKGFVLAVALVALTFMATGPAPAEATTVTVTCSQPDCTYKCKDAYHEKLLAAACRDTAFGKLCVCYHT
ncbi:hypothetical protein FH972_001617 [Carpinus fangiana]|uniref:Bifunctional inhibitor/plant lipid transfer protein/seed storage helical domain-containing protein n=1 Tax=Carpinus fangiana TaxID=176857 RepID=A0A5N6QEN9_9ROSI|nr:hypothetical protein FH972_001617 [Carpinus fangiana]